MKWSRKLKKNRQNSNVPVVIPDPPKKVSDLEPDEIDLDDPEQNGVKIDKPKESSDQDKE